MALIEDHALIGDCHSAALVCRDGTIDWLCLPRFDNAACLAALLGDRENGMWRIAPAGTVVGTTRRYLDDTMVLETLFETAEGAVAVIDFMSIAPSHVIRLVEGRRGTVPCLFELLLRCDNGRAAPPLSRLPSGHGIRAGAGPRHLVSRSDVPLEIDGSRIAARFDVAAGERIGFSLSHGDADPPCPERALADTVAYWRNWSARSPYNGRWREPVRRSLLTLKALTYRPSGGIAAAVTTSLPEQIGGTRNWDYRYCWPRDASLAALAFAATGHNQEAEAWTGWLARTIGAGPSALRTLYGVSGEPASEERDIPWLRGYEGSHPVRIGNNAVTQRQWDMFGEIEMSFRGAVTHWSMRRALIEHMETVWRDPDEGIWEIRGGPRDYTFSKVMVWVALDRAIRAAETHRLPAPLDRWRRLRRTVHDLVCISGFNPTIGSFTQVLGGSTLDASLSLLPLLGFLPPDDPRIIGTVGAIGAGLTVDGLIRRYNAPDGLPPGEGVFLPCCFWYASALSLVGRRIEAEALFERLLGLCNDTGLLSEEYDPVACRQLGNFPQAFSHLALIGTALVLDGTETLL